MISYYEYTSAQCSDDVIQYVCSFCSSKNELLDNAQNGFEDDKECILGQGWLISGAISTLTDDSVFCSRKMNLDAQLVYQRCLNKLKWMKSKNRNGIAVDREYMFDTLVEVNWLLGSMIHSKNNKKRNIILMSDLTACREALRNALLVIYNSAVEDHNECVYIDEALQARMRILTGLYPFRFEESKKYLSQEYNTTTIKEWRKDFRKRSIEKMALFLGLTITAAKAEEIRKCQNE